MRACCPSRFLLTLGVVNLLLMVSDARGQGVESVRWTRLMDERFVENRGQWPDEVRFAAGSGNRRVWVAERSVSFLLHDEESGRAVTVRLSIDASAGLGPPIGAGRLEGSHHFLLGSDPDGWKPNAAAYGSVIMESPDGGTTLRVLPRMSGARLIVEVAPWASPCDLVFQTEGAAVTSSAGDGSPTLSTLLGALRFVCDECGDANGSGCSACGSVRLEEEGRLRWSIPPHDEATAGQVSVGLEWSTYFGGTGPDRLTAVAVADDGSVVVAGHTFSTDFPITPGAFDPTHAPHHLMFFDNDVFVSRLSSDGSDLLFSTFLGGSVNDFGVDVVVGDSNEPIVLADATSASDYPTTPGAFQPISPSLSGGTAVTRLTADGTSLVFSTFVVGSRGANPNAMVLMPDGGFVIVGSTCSPDYPVTLGAYDTTLHEPGPLCQNDGVVTKLSSGGTSLIFSTYLGATGSDTVFTVDRFPDGSLALAGRPGIVGPFGMGTSDFPTTPRAFQTTVGSSFVARLSADGSDLMWSSFFGGDAPHRIHGLGVDASGTITVAGTTGFLSPSDTFPTTPGAFDETYNGQEDGFVSRISADGTTLLSSTLLGSPGREQLKRMVVDPSGVATLLGHTDGGLPVTPGAYDVTPNGGWDFFVTRLSPQSDRLFYSTYLGGSADETSQTGDDPDLALRPDGQVVMVAEILSLDYPTTPGSFDPDPTAGLGADGVVSQLSMLPAGVVGYGTSSPGCAGSLTIGVSSMPQLGNDSFSVWSSGATPFANRSWLGLATAAPSTPIRVAGIDLWLKPSALLLLPTRADAAGYSEVRLAVPNVPALLGLQVYAQSLWADPCGSAGWAASRGLAITVQP